MQSGEPAKTIIFVAASAPDSGIEQDMEALGLKLQWACSIKAAAGFLNLALDGTVVVTELALADGNWRDLVERVRRLGKPIPIALVALASTAELWWDALDCGVEEVLPAPLSASELRQFLNNTAAVQRLERI